MVATIFIIVSIFINLKCRELSLRRRGQLEDYFIISGSNDDSLDEIGARRSKGEEMLNKYLRDQNDESCGH